MKFFYFLAILLSILNAAQLPQKTVKNNLELSQVTQNVTQLASAGVAQIKKVAMAEIAPSTTVEKRETKIYHFVGLSMSQEELTWYLVIFGIILIIFVVLCFVL